MKLRKKVSLNSTFWGTRQKVPCSSPIPRFAWNSGRKKFHADRPFPVLHGTPDAESSMQIAHSPFCMELRTQKVPCRSAIPRFAWNSGRKKFHADHPPFCMELRTQSSMQILPFCMELRTQKVPCRSPISRFAWNSTISIQQSPYHQPAAPDITLTEPDSGHTGGCTDWRWIRATSSIRATTSIRTTTSFPRVRSAPSHHAHVAPVPRYNCPASAANPSFLPMYPGC